MSAAYSTHLGPAGVGTIALPVSTLSTAQYLQMIEVGILGPGNKVELIGGLITPMAPAGPEHGSSLMQLTRQLAAKLDEYELLVQGTVVIGEGNVFDPDVTLLRRKPEGYKGRHPRPEDILLIIESASSSLPRDRHVKLPVYAAASIQEYWIADLERETVTVYRDPDGGRYRLEAIHSGEATISPLACPSVSIRVADIFA